jgi:GntR family transcriptional regulator, transcriptional repressor for pyruvate dehydrogenase complex
MQTEGGMTAKYTSAVERIAENLRAMALAHSDAELLGSEDGLVSQLSVSRPTLRQAAALVAQERLISIKRGVGGGYFAARPDSMTVARMAAIYLRSRNASLGTVSAALDPIRTELARQASHSADPDKRQRIEAFLETERRIDPETLDYRMFLRSERAFGRLLGEIGGNAVLALFLSIVYDLTALVGREQDVYVNRPDRVQQYREQRNRMAAAILESDEEMAVLATKRCTAILAQWMQEDLANRRAAPAAEGRAKRARDRS